MFFFFTLKLSLYLKLILFDLSLYVHCNKIYFNNSI